MTKHAAAMIVLLSCLEPGWAAPETAGAYVWIEAESIDSNALEEFKQVGGDVCSGGMIQYVLAKGKKPKALALSYGFEVETEGRYRLWMRIGPDSIRSPLQWRVDDGEWRDLPGEQPATDLMEVWEWWGLGWIDGGEMPLSRGRHTLEIRVDRAGRDGRQTIGLDCFTFAAPSFHPSGSLKPGERYDEAIDRQAATQVFGDEEPWAAFEKTNRKALPLAGPWQVARWDDPHMDQNQYEQVKRIPAAEEYLLQWRGIAVPGDAFSARKDMKLGHRFFYRTNVAVPRTLAGRSFQLHFPKSGYIISVFLNGKYVGGHKTVAVPWRMDITQGIRPGEINELIIAVKSPWYAVSSYGTRDHEEHLKNPDAFSIMPVRSSPGAIGGMRMADAAGWHGMPTGLIETPLLAVAGNVYSDDVFIRTSVRDKTLAADVTLRNTGSEPARVQVRCSAIHDRSNTVEKEFSALDGTVPPGKNATLHLQQTWPNPRLWWPEKNAEVYRMRTEVWLNGAMVDSREDTFGFREVTYEGWHCYLNGVRWHFWCHQGMESNYTEADDWFTRYRRLNMRFARPHAGIHPQLGKSVKAMEVYDREGVAIFLSNDVSGQVMTYAVQNPVFWKNLEDYVRDYVRAYRNHPCILVWSLENELLLINCRGVDYRECEKKMAKIIDAQRELDPTRRGMADGAGALGGLCDLHNVHYTFWRQVNFPSCVYAYDIGPTDLSRRGSWDQKYRWNGNIPLIFGEAFFYTLGNPDMAWIGGPDVYRSTLEMDRAATRFARICTEGARWQDVMANCLFARVDLPYKETFKAFAPQAVFVREHNSNFWSGGLLQRTFRVFNDVRYDKALTLRWEIVFENRRTADGEKVYRLTAGHHQEDRLECRLPEVARRTDGRLMLRLYDGETMVFEDSKPISVFPHVTAVAAKKGLEVYDPTGTVADWLTKRTVAFRRLDTPEASRDAALLLIGHDAITPENRKAVSTAIKSFAQAGGAAIVLEQAAPLMASDLPYDLMKIDGLDNARKRGDREKIWAEFAGVETGVYGTIGFPTAMAHPIVQGAKNDDFFTWTGDDYIYKKSYLTPESKAIPIVQAGDKLGLSPMCELPYGKGTILLSQLLIGSKLGAEPMADHLLNRILAWAAGRSSAVRFTCSAMLSQDRILRRHLDTIRLKYSDENAAGAETGNFDASGERGAFTDRDHHIAVARADAPTLEQLAANRETIRRWCEKGNYLMLVNLDRQGLRDFNRLVGFEHELRPFRVERVRLTPASAAEPLMLGIPNSAFSQLATDMIAPWIKKYSYSGRVFTHVVDYEEVGAFGTSGESKLFDGLINSDFWHYVQYIVFEPAKDPGRFASGKIDLDVPLRKRERIRQVNIRLSKTYYIPKDIRIVFDGNENDAVDRVLEDTESEQELAFEPRDCENIRIELLSYYHEHESKKNTLTIDELRILRDLPKDVAKRVVPLTSPAGLVKYPIGKGAILLNQLDYTEEKPDAASKSEARALVNIEQNRVKKAFIMSSLLRNMGADFLETPL